MRNELVLLNQRHTRIQDQAADTEIPLPKLVGEWLAAQSKLTALSSKITAQTGWDVSVLAGMRGDLERSGRQEGFVALTATYSFGKPAADRAAAKVETLTTRLLNEQRGGNAQNFQRAKDTVMGLLGVQTVEISNLEARLKLTKDTLARVRGVDSEEGQRVRRSLEVERKADEARLAGAKVRLDYLKEWISFNV